MGQSKIEIVAATLDHAGFIAENVRRDDSLEIWASSMMTPFDAMRLGIKYSDHSMVALADGLPVCMWGIMVDSLILDTATPWLIATDGIEKKEVIRSFAKIVPGALVSMIRNYGTLENYVDARNKRSIRWLKHIGFTIDDAEPYGMLQLPFHRFHIERKGDHV